MRCWHYCLAVIICLRSVFSQWPHVCITLYVESDLVSPHLFVLFLFDVNVVICTVYCIGARLQIFLEVSFYVLFHVIILPYANMFLLFYLCRVNLISLYRTFFVCWWGCLVLYVIYALIPCICQLVFELIINLFWFYVSFDLFVVSVCHLPLLACISLQFSIDISIWSCVLLFLL